MDDALKPLTAIATGILAIALVAVLVSQKANTAGVFGAFGSMFSNMLSAATAPVTGQGAAPINSPNAGGLGLPSLQMPGFGLN